MIVVTLTDCPLRLRGDLSKWLMEINTGVYVGKASARVREELWKRICKHAVHGRAAMVFSANNEQGMSFYVHNTTWKPEDFEGITLMRRPAEAGSGKIPQSNAGIQQMLRGQNAAKIKKKKKEGYIVVDLETTGLKSETDEIIELAGIRIIDHQIKEEISLLVRPEQAIPEEITKLTGITPDMIEKDGHPLEEALEKFLDFIGDSTIISHNLNFDRAFLNAACKKAGKEKLRNAGRDTLSIARRTIDDIENYKLTTLAKYFELPKEESHRALPDSRTTYRLYEKLKEI